MFFVKKILSRFLFPVPLSLELLFLGLFFLWFTRRQRTGKVLVAFGTLLLIGLSSFIGSITLLHPLEYRYHALNLSDVPGASAVSFIAVLGGEGDDDPDVPVTSHVYPDLMVRLVEGVRLHRQIPRSKLILSGDRASAAGMTKVAEALGVSADDIGQLSQPRDTEGEARQIATVVGSQPFILVTSASHMPRAMQLFKRRGLAPIPAPTDYLTPHRPREFDDLVPDAYKLFKSQIAIYEYLGLAWETLRGKI
jgi:uncharacterized SAM-binding protein YcdF (DUF218 family)